MEFTEDYQKELIQKLTKRQSVEELAPLLHPEAFSIQLQPVVESVLAEWSKGRVLSPGQLRQVCAREQVKLLPVQSWNNSTFDLEEVRKFARYRAVRQSLVYANSLNEQGDYAGAMEKVSTCMSKVPDETKKGIDLFADAPSSHARKGIVPTGVPQLDEALGGGIAQGELSVIMAPTGGGKTAWLVWIAIQAVRAGKRVQYVTLEVPDYEIQHRALRCMLKEPTKAITRAMWERGTKRLRKKDLFRIIEHSPQTVSVDELSREMADDREILIVDYADNLSAPYANSSYEALGQVYEGLKALGMSRRIPIWTASQVNRPAYQDDVKTIGVEFVSDSIRKMQCADQVISLKLENPTAKTPNGALFLAKNRHGRGFQKVNVTVNWPISSFTKGHFDHG